MFSAWDLVRLTCSPETFSKESSSLQMFGKEVIGDVTNSRISSANSALFWLVCPLWTPLIFGLDLIAIAKVSIAKANIRGDRGHPCRVPLEILIGSN